jgi:hypothetical protein
MGRACARRVFDMDVVMTNRTVLTAWGVCLALTCGCAQWTPPPASELSRLPMPPLAPDSVVLEMTFVRISKDAAEFEGRFWPEVDETPWGAEDRRRWSSNGFRCGLVGSPPPPVLQEVLDLQSPSELGEGVTTIEPGSDVVARSHRLRNRAGNPTRIVVRSNPVERLAALTYDPLGSVRGETFEQAQCYFTVTSFPLGDGRVRLELLVRLDHAAENRSNYGVAAFNVNNMEQIQSIMDPWGGRSKTDSPVIVQAIARRPLALFPRRLPAAPDAGGGRTVPADPGHHAPGPRQQRGDVRALSRTASPP